MAAFNLTIGDEHSGDSHVIEADTREAAIEQGNAYAQTRNANWTVQTVNGSPA